MEAQQTSHLKSRYNHAMGRLTSSGLRRTKFRSNLLSLLIESEPYALSVEEILSHPTTERPDTVTVYRNIQALTRIGIIDCVADEKGRFRYRLNETDGPQLKIACRDCHTTLVRSSPMLPELESVARGLGYSALSSRWEITGYCEDCAKERSS